jgi:hypothetical protein
MSDASASSSSTTAIDASGSGVINVNKPNYVMWAVVGLALVLAAYLFVNRKK